MHVGMEAWKARRRVGVSGNAWACKDVIQLLPRAVDPLSVHGDVEARRSGGLNGVARPPAGMRT
jgi:hypothetical protein